MCNCVASKYKIPCSFQKQFYTHVKQNSWLLTWLLHSLSYLVTVDHETLSLLYLCNSVQLCSFCRTETIWNLELATSEFMLLFVLNFQECVSLILFVSVMKVRLIVHPLYWWNKAFLIAVPQLCLSWPSAGASQTWESLVSSQGCCTICECVFLVTLNCSFLPCCLTLANSHLRLQLRQKQTYSLQVQLLWNSGLFCLCEFLLVFSFIF